MYPEDNINMAKRILNYFHCSKLKFVFLQVKLPNLLQIIFCKRLIKNESREAVVQRCSIEKMFLEISQNSQENTCVRVHF